jgi:hypothetical protein
MKILEMKITQWIVAINKDIPLRRALRNTGARPAAKSAHLHKLQRDNVPTQGKLCGLQPVPE